MSIERAKDAAAALLLVGAIMILAQAGIRLAFSESVFSDNSFREQLMTETANASGGWAALLAGLSVVLATPLRVRTVASIAFFVEVAMVIAGVLGAILVLTYTVGEVPSFFSSSPNRAIAVLEVVPGTLVACAGACIAYAARRTSVDDVDSTSEPSPIPPQPVQ